MIDHDGYRPNTAIVLLNDRNQVFWAKRIGEQAWQFPQGGIQDDETPVDAMYRELYEEIGLKPDHVEVIAHTANWLYYDVPNKYLRRNSRRFYRGQKQIWFLLRLVAGESEISLTRANSPEFDDWVWHDFWVPLDQVVDFKRKVYVEALHELGGVLSHGLPDLPTEWQLHLSQKK